MKSIILSEGSSLTARETLTALSESGFQIDILTSAKFSITTFSRWKRKMISTANVNQNPKEYLKTVEKLLQSGQYITVLPTHEEAWLFAEGAGELPEHCFIPVADSGAFHQVQGKIAFARLADQLEIPQPAWQPLDSDIKPNIDYPYWLKADYGTAGRSVYKVNNITDHKRGILLLKEIENQLMIQTHIEGQYGQVQAVFNHGELLAAHTSLQWGRGTGGSAAARLSIENYETIEHIKKIGRRINWHGGLTLDFIYKDGRPYYIECNPRMIEPANAALAGVNFPEILVNLSLGKLPEKVLIGKAGVKSHSTMALIMGTAEKTKSRREILKTLWQGLRRKGAYTGSIEVLTSYQKDLSSIIPLMAVLSQLLVNPRKVKSIAANAVANYCVLPETITKIRE